MADKSDEKMATTALASFLSGALSSGLGKTVVAPLDRTKINFQVTNTQYTMRKAFNYMVRTQQKEGIGSLWRGNTAALARTVPYSGIMFASNDVFNKLLKVDDGPAGHPKPLRRFLAGSMAGLLAHTTTYPLDVARTRMAITNKMYYGTLYRAVREMVKKEGWRSVYLGYTASLVGVIPSSGVLYGMYGLLKTTYGEYKGRELNALEQSACGSLSGATAMAISYPMEIVRRRHQAAAIVGERKTTIFETLKSIHKEKGSWKGFYKGASINLIKEPIQMGISFSLFELGKTLFEELFS